MVGRIPILEVSPLVDCGRLPAKATEGEALPIRATVIREGHDQLSAEVILIGPDRRRRAPVRMTTRPETPDRYTAWVTPDAPGAWSFEVQAWSDPLATWRHDAAIKIRAGVDVELMFTEGRLLLQRVQRSLSRKADPEVRELLKAATAAAKDTRRPPEARLAALEDDTLWRVLAANPLRELVTTAGPHPLFADRRRALFGSWYELFPRSEGSRVDDDGRAVSGTLRTAAQRLDAVAAMGFDVVYLPPIHPIGEVNRKGPNNTLDPGPADPGSPWAIGSKDGGHDAIHSDLGDFDDFDAFVARTRELGMEVALDLALQCAPDHPWVTSHPAWFTTRADGSIAYAENPPKKYQDIYPLNFDNDPEGIRAEVLRVVRLWMSHGVRIFRVDNPHTKPVQFWEWLLAEVRRTDPDVLFLAEAFTKPAMMRALGAVGFHQSYTYFTWRNGKDELADYLTELSSQTDHLMRPNFFVNTPDILHAFLQYGGPDAFKIRAALAATGSPSWGVYAGFELFEHVAVRPGSEEYLDSEKYQIRVRDWAGADAGGHTLAPYLTRLNEIRRAHPALQQLRDLTIHGTEDPAILAFSKRAGDDIVLVIVNVDPHATRETMVHLDMPALGRQWFDAIAVTDEITGQAWTWHERNFVRLGPGGEPAHILAVKAPA